MVYFATRLIPVRVSVSCGCLHRLVYSGHMKLLCHQSFFFFFVKIIVMRRSADLFKMPFYAVEVVVLNVHVCQINDDVFMYKWTHCDWWPRQLNLLGNPLEGLETARRQLALGINKDSALTVARMKIWGFLGTKRPLTHPENAEG